MERRSKVAAGENEELSGRKDMMSLFLAKGIPEHQVDAELVIALYVG